jgi:hypothetical protein
MFISYKSGNYGSDNFIVSRLMIEIPNIIELYDINIDFRQEIIDIVHNISEELLTCYKIQTNVLEEVKQVEEEIEKGKYLVKTFGEKMKKPYVIDLKSDCDNFLYHAKSSIRDLIRILDKVYSNINGERDLSVIAKYLERQASFDKKNSEYMKKENQRWIKSMIEMRNAVEHPYNDKQNRELIIDNYQVDFHKKKYTDPRWKFTMDNLILVDEYIVTSMEYYICNLVMFCENIIIMIFEDKYSENRIIPIKERELSDMKNCKRFDY